MEMNENLVTEVAENTEQTAEQTPEKTYTQEEVNAIVGKRLARSEAKIRKEYDREYGDLLNTLEAGTGAKGVKELNDTFSQFYQSKGIKIEKKPKYSEKDIEVLARAEADEFIQAGFEDVVDEVDRLTKIGAANMTDREKALFKVLAEHRQTTEKSRELAKIGVTEELYNSKEFQDFASKFNANTPIADIYDIYNKTQPKKEFKTMGSMKNATSENNGVKDYYSYEEASRFTRKELEDNPELFKAIENSMAKWK